MTSDLSHLGANACGMPVLCQALEGAYSQSSFPRCLLLVSHSYTWIRHSLCREILNKSMRLQMTLQNSLGMHRNPVFILVTQDIDLFIEKRWHTGESSHSWVHSPGAHQELGRGCSKAESRESSWQVSHTGDGPDCRRHHCCPKGLKLVESWNRTRYYNTGYSETS